MESFLYIINHQQGRHFNNIFRSCYTLLLTSLSLLALFPLIIICEKSDSSQQQQQCGGYAQKCGMLDVPFPFYVNSSSNTPPACSLPDAFRLSCLQLKNSTPSLFLSIDDKIGSRSISYQVLDFFPDGILLDFPNTVRLPDDANSTTSSSSSSSSSSFAEYNDLKSFGFEGKNRYFGISTDNMLGLYDCEDSSLCKPDCENINTVLMTPVGSKNHSTTTTSSCEKGLSACCYPLSDHSSWRIGDDFSVFSQFGCREFSSWVTVPCYTANNSDVRKAMKRGVKLEWAFPSDNSRLFNTSYNKGSGAANSTMLCAPNAYIVNATSVTSGIRCKCQDGFTGDGFVQGVGCLRSCVKDGQKKLGRDCHTKRNHGRKLEVLAGILILAFSIASSVMALCCLLNSPSKSGCSKSTISFNKANRTRLFTYHELEEATKGFEECQKLVDSSSCKLFAGVLGDGLNIVVHKVEYGSERDLNQVLSQVDVLSAVSHQNMACLLGCSIDRGDTPLVVYEYPASGTLLEQLHKSKEHKIGLDWYTRLNIVVETASVLAFLQCEISPSIFHNDLHSGCIFLDEEFSVRIAGFELLSGTSRLGEAGSDQYSHGKRMHCFYKSDVYNLGVVLLEIIAGATTVPLELVTIGLQKIRSGKLEEIVDPLLYYHEQPGFCKEQIERVADLATRCLLFGGDGKLSMTDAARELLHIRTTTSAAIGGSSRKRPALEETFSNSSLLQMMSMSPDSIYVP